MLILGLVISLALAPVVLALADQLHLDLPDIGRPVVAWVATGITVAIATFGLGTWRQALGVSVFTSASVHWGVPAILFAIVFAALNVYLPKWIGYRSEKQKQLFQAPLYMPLWKKCFFLASAAITEEVLYRGYAVGIGAHILGGFWIAAVLSVVAFTAAHYWYGVAQLPQVFVLAVGLTALFIVTGNLWLCIGVHALLDSHMLARPTPGAPCADQLNQGAG